MSAKSHCSIFHLCCCTNFPPIPSASEGAGRYVDSWLWVFFLLHLLLRLVSFKMLKLVCWDRKAFKCSKHSEVREEFVLDVTPETALSGDGGGYSAGQAENELDAPLMVMCHSKRPSPPQGGRSIPVACHGCHAVSWWSLHLVLASTLNISPLPLPTDPTPNS